MGETAVRRSDETRNWAALRYHVTVLLLVLPTSMFLAVATVYLVNTAYVSTFQTGLYVSTSTLLGIVLTTLLRHRLGVAEPSVAIPAILLLQLAAVVLVGLAAFSPGFLIPAAAATACGQLILPAVFAYDGRYGPTAGTQTNKGIYGIRLVMSLSWIIGPSLAFGVLALAGYSVVAVAISLSMIIGSAGLLRRARTMRAAAPQLVSQPTSAPHRGPPFWILFLTLIAVTSANSLHSIALPLYLLDVLSADLYFPGLVMTAAALVEVAVIALIQRYDGAAEGETVLWGAIVLGLLYFLALPFLTNPVLILFAQLLYGAHFALVTTVCLPLLRNALSGTASNLGAQFVNGIKIGTLVGGGLFALGAERLGYLGLVSQVCALLLAVGLLLGGWRWLSARIHM